MSTFPSAPTETRSRTAAYRAFADGRKRHLLGVVHRRTPPAVSTRDLATRLAAFERGVETDAVTDEERDRAHVTVRHALVPALIDAGLLRRREGEDAVVAADHPLLEDEAVANLVLDPDRAGDESIDALFDALADDRRRTVLSVLADGSPATIAALARDVAARESGRRPGDASPDRVERVRVSLHHAHLPRLADAGLVRYDREDSDVAFDGHPDLRRRWFDETVPDSDGSTARLACAGSVGTSANSDF